MSNLEYGNLTSARPGYFVAVVSHAAPWYRLYPVVCWAMCHDDEDLPQDSVVPFITDNEYSAMLTSARDVDALGLFSAEDLNSADLIARLIDMSVHKLARDYGQAPTDMYIAGSVDNCYQPDTERKAKDVVGG